MVTLPSPAIHLSKPYRSLHIDFLRGCLLRSVSVFWDAYYISTPSLCLLLHSTHNDFKGIWTVNKTCGPLCRRIQPISQTSRLYQLRNYMCPAAAMEFIVGIWNWKCLRLEEMSGFKSGILKLYTAYSYSKALLIKHGDWMSLACNWCAESCFVSAGVMPSKRLASEGSESVWWFRVIVWQLMEREWKTAWQNFTTLWSDGWN